MELATILEDNMQAHLRKEYEPKAEAHREEMAMILREELTPIVYADLCAEMRPTVNSDLRAEQLPLVQQEMEDYSKQRMEDTENACNTQFNNEWEDMEIELKAVWKRRAETRKAEMEENVDRCLIQRWEDGRIRGRSPNPSVFAPIGRTSRVLQHVSAVFALKTYFLSSIFIHKKITNSNII